MTAARDSRLVKAGELLDVSETRTRRIPVLSIDRYIERRCESSLRRY